ncbi:MAG: stage V sporulation protein AA [Clostridiales bacterium]|nr:stage V sporulation protein AA [Clostridiales bacterium]
MDVYIQPMKKSELHNKSSITLKEIADIVCPIELKNKLAQLEIKKINGKLKQVYVISAADIVDKIIQAVPDSKVNIIGEQEVLIDYKPEIKKINKFVEAAKIFFISVVLFIGSSSAIMSFQSEAQMLKVFRNYYRIFLGIETDRPALMTVSYSIGLCFGIMVFFNHFFSKKFTDDPTPIEIELNSYEEEATKSIINSINAKENENASY